MRMIVRFIRFLQVSLDKLLCLLLLLTGSLMLAWFHTALPMHADPYIAQYTPDVYNALPDPTDPVQSQRYTLVGGLLALAGLLTTLPRLPKTAKRIIRFKSDKGDVDVNLKAIQDTLNRVMNALPEVKHMRVRVVPSRDRKRISLEAEAVLIKDVERSARAIADHVKRSLHVAAANLLGGDMVVHSELYISNVVLAKNTNVMDIAALPAESPEGPYLEGPESDRWEQADESKAPSYLPNSAVAGAAAVHAAAHANSQSTPATDERETAEDEFAEEDTPLVIPDDDYDIQSEPDAPEESPYEAPSQRRDPLESIDQIIMPDSGDDQDEPVSRPLFADDDDASTRREA